MRNAELDEAQARMKITRRNIGNLRYADDITLMAESEKEVKSLLMKVKVESENIGLKLDIQKIKIMTSGPIFSWQIDGETVETLADFIFLGSKNHCRWWLQSRNQKTLASWKKTYDQPRQHIKKQRLYFANKGPSSQTYGFSSGHVWMWELDCEESWALKNWCFWTVVVEKALESPLDCKEIQPVHPKVDQSWVFIGRTDAEAETPTLQPPDAKNWIIGKDPDAGRLKAGGEGDDRGWGGWVASPMRWSWVWVRSWSWWWTGRPGVLQSMGSQRVGHDSATELNWERKFRF